MAFVRRAGVKFRRGRCIPKHTVCEPRGVKFRAGSLIPSHSHKSSPPLPWVKILPMILDFRRPDVLHNGGDSCLHIGSHMIELKPLKIKVTCVMSGFNILSTFRHVGLSTTNGKHPTDDVAVAPPPSPRAAPECARSAQDGPGEAITSQVIVAGDP